MRNLIGVIAVAAALGVATPAGAFPWDDMMPTIQTDCVKHDFTNILGVPLLSGTVWHSIVTSLAATVPGIVAAEQYTVASAMAYGGCVRPAKPPSVVAWEATQSAPAPVPAPVPIPPSPALLPVLLDGGAGEAVSDARLRWNPAARGGLCIGTNDACATYVWPASDNHTPLLVVTGTHQPDGTPGYSDVSYDVVQQSTAPNDPRALACFNVFAQGSIGQFCAYGTNYPGGGGQTKFAGYNGVHIVAYSGDIKFILGGAVGDEVGRFNEHGFGIHDVPNDGCSGCFSQGIGSWVSAASRPWWGYDIFAKMAPDGIVRPHVRHSDGSIQCLTC